MNHLKGTPENTGGTKMDHMHMWWAFILLGLAAGVIGGMLGVGGGILMVPMLIWIAGLPDKQAKTWSLAVMIPMALAATLRNVAHQDQVGKLDLLPVGIMAIAAIAGAYFGAKFLKDFSGVTLKRLFAVLMFASAIKMGFFTRAKKVNESSSEPAPAAAGAAESGSPTLSPGEVASPQTPEEKQPE